MKTIAEFAKKHNITIETKLIGTRVDNSLEKLTQKLVGIDGAPSLAGISLPLEGSSNYFTAVKDIERQLDYALTNLYSFLSWGRQSSYWQRFCECIERAKESAEYHLKFAKESPAQLASFQSRSEFRVELSCCEFVLGVGQIRVPKYFRGEADFEAALLRARESVREDKAYDDACRNLGETQVVNLEGNITLFDGVPSDYFTEKVGVWTIRAGKNTSGRFLCVAYPTNEKDPRYIEHIEGEILSASTLPGSYTRRVGDYIDARHRIKIVARINLPINPLRERQQRLLK